MSKLDEYKSLREEIVRLERETVNITLYVLTGTLASSGLVLINNSNLGFIIPFLFQILLIWGLRRNIDSFSLRRRISAYVKVFLEPNLEGLQWEKQNENFKSLEDKNGFKPPKEVKSPKMQKVINKIYKLMKKWTDIFFLLSLLGVFITVKASIGNLCSLKSNISELVVFVFLVLAHIIAIFILIKLFFFSTKTSQYINNWEEVKKKEEE